MPTLYEILGAPTHASADELRRAYHRAARRLHPDVNPDVDADAMRQLNQAWAVLGAPASRLSYDRSLRRGVAGGIAAAEQPQQPEQSTGGRIDGGQDPAIPTLARVLRPSVVIIAVLLVIFLVTAYAGPGPSDRSPATIPSTPSPSAVPAGAPAPTGPTGPVASPPEEATTAPAGVPLGPLPEGTSAARLVGQCLQIVPSYDAVVSCSTANNGRVVTVADAVNGCPPATRAYRLTSLSQIVCLGPSSP